MTAFLKVALIVTILLFSVSCYENSSSYDVGMINFEVEFTNSHTDRIMIYTCYYNDYSSIKPYRVSEYMDIYGYQKVVLKQSIAANHVFSLFVKSGRLPSDYQSYIQKINWDDKNRQIRVRY